MNRKFSVCVMCEVSWETEGQMCHKCRVEWA